MKIPSTFRAAWYRLTTASQHVWQSSIAILQDDQQAGAVGDERTAEVAHPLLAHPLASDFLKAEEFVEMRALALRLVNGNVTED